MSSKHGNHTSVSLGTRLLVEERGQMTILSLIFFVMLIAVGGLAIDMGRLYSLQGQVQTFVDTTALASGSQLDGQTGAICRAISAAVGPATGNPVCTQNALVTGQQYFAAGSHQLSVSQLMFLSALAPDPGARAPTPVTGANGDTVVCTVVAPLFSTSGCPANADSTARFVEVRDNPEQLSFLILPVARMLVGTTVTQETIGLKATAGYRSQICDTTPLMICNPSEPSTNTNTLLPYSPIIGQQILMKASSSGGGGGSSWAPGDFGLINPAPGAGAPTCSGGGANQVRCMLGAVNPLSQCSTNAGIGIQPGQATSVSDGLNVRFGIYTGSMQGNKNDSAFAPSVNVTKGICQVSGGNCQNGLNNGQFNQFGSDPSGTNLVRLPRDANIVADGDNGSVRFGTGVWDAAGYWLANHGTSTLPAALLALAPPGGIPTRYQTYRYEIETNFPHLIPDNSGLSPRNESGYVSTGINNASRDRRTLIMSVVNCHAGGINGSASGVPVVAFVKMFVTEPSGLNAAGAPAGGSFLNNIFGEVEGVIRPNDNTGVLHQGAVLYR